jgi:hypothetical protein
LNKPVASVSARAARMTVPAMMELPYVKLSCAQVSGSAPVY